MARQAILGWRYTDAPGGPPIGCENFSGVLCEVLFHGRPLTGPEEGAMNFSLSAKYGLPVTPIPARAPGGFRHQRNRIVPVGLHAGPPIPTPMRQQPRPQAGWAKAHPALGPEPAKFFRLQATN